VITPRYLTPPKIAQTYGVDVHQVLGWIASGELRAINLAASAHGRPRYKISPSDLSIFEQRRSVQAPAPSVRRRRKAIGNVTQYF
jgi:hypothetical protein